MFRCDIPGVISEADYIELLGVVAKDYVYGFYAVVPFSIVVFHEGNRTEIESMSPRVEEFLRAKFPVPNARYTYL